MASRRGRSRVHRDGAQERRAPRLPQRHLARAGAAHAVERTVQIGRFARGAARRGGEVGTATPPSRRFGGRASAVRAGARRDHRPRGEEPVISEPMTLATDYLLAAVTAFLALRILQHSEGQNARRLWGAAFVALALGAALGGTHHGFRVDALWKPTVLVIGLASGGMLAGSALATPRGRLRHVLLALPVVKLAAFSLWTWRDDRLLWVVADTGLA